MADVVNSSTETSPQASEPSQGMTRREFLANSLVASVFFATAVGVANAVIRYLIPPKQIMGGASERLEVGTVAEVSDGSSKSFAYNGIPCAVINLGGEIKGFSRVCTHLQCAIDWDKDSKTFLCPCHAAVFDSNGAVVSGPAPKPLPALKIDISDGKIYVGGWA